jgi:hypothetical protein
MAFPSTSRRAGLALGSLVVGYLLIDLVAGAPDSPLVPPLPTGVPRPGWTTTGARWIGLDRLTRTGLTAVSIALLIAIVAAFFLVAVDARRGRVGAAPVLIAACLSLALSVASPVMLSRDVYSYAAYGRIYALHDENPYVRTPSAFPSDPFVAAASPAWIDTRAVYGPAFVLTGAGVARAWAGSPGATLLAFKVLAGIGAVLATALAAWAARSVRRRDAAAAPELSQGTVALAAAAVGLNPVIVIHTVGGAHNDAMIAAALAGALVLAVRWLREGPADGLTRSTGRSGGEPGRGVARAAIGPVPLGVTALLTLAGLIKVVVFPVLLVWLWYLLRASPRGRRGVGLAFHGGAAAALSLAFSAPFLDSARALTSLVTLASVEGWASPARLAARGAKALGNGIGGSGAGNVLGKVVVVGFLAWFAAAFIGFFRRGAGRAAQGPDHLANAWGACALGLALAIPYLLPWYAAWFLPFLALMTDGGLAMIGFVAAGLLALTGVPAEPGSAPGLWRDMILGVHYGIAPVMLGLFLAWAGRVLGIGPRHRTELDAVPRMADRARP